MLSQLLIQNFAIIDNLDINFNAGMSVITGETGAGKSIAVDALGLALGDRADSGIVKHGAKRSEISAVFDVSHNPPALHWLQSHELDDENDCILRRTISAEGGSKAYINGRPATLQQIKSLGEMLIDIHSQHQHQSLLRSDTHRKLLDSYGKCTDLASEVKNRYRHWQHLEEQLKNIQAAAHERTARIEFLQFQLDELQELNIQHDEWQTLEAEHKQLANAEKIQQTINQCLEELYQNDNAISSQLEHLNQSLLELEEYLPNIKSSADLLNSALINIDEAVNELRDLQQEDSNDPQKLSAIESRLGELLDIARKHHCKPNELPQVIEKLENELNPLLNAEESLEGLEKAIQKAQTDYQDTAKQLSKKRSAAAKKLSKACDEILADLGMKHCQLNVALQPIDAATGSPTGNEKVNFLVSTNPGNPFKPLIKVASGGELSRISLAIQVVTAKLNSFPVLVFDEVDVGIGGGTAEVVGKLLRQLADDKQVICITHQAQVAAQGQHHWTVEKQARNDATITQMKKLDDEEREIEIARMIGGLKLTTATQKHAKEMLNSAKSGAKT